MGRKAPRFVGKVIAIGASFALHGVAFAAAAYGHGSGKAGAGNDVQTLEMLEIAAPEIVSAPVPPPDAPKPETVENTPAQAAPTHTHDYPVPPSHDATPHDPNLVHLPFDHDHESAPDPRATPEHEAAPAPEVAATAAPTTPHFSISLSPGATNAAPLHGIVRAGGDGDGTAGVHASGAPEVGSAENPAGEGQVDVPAKIAYEPQPHYTQVAAEQGIEADVPVEIVVDANGNVRSSRATGHAGFGLDEAAVSGVRAYRFTPAKRGGHAVAVRMKWVVQFKMR